MNASELLIRGKTGASGCIVRETYQVGLGVFATRFFEPGEIVVQGTSIRRAERNDAHAVQLGRAEFGHEEGIGSFVNHSCDPNCKFRISAGGLFDLVARRPISRDEQITLDYATRNYVIEFFPLECQCGTPLCRGLITGWKDLPDDRRSAYDGAIAPYILEIEQAVGNALIGE